MDRSLGGRVVPSALRAAGWRLRTLAEVYGDRQELVPDDEWLELCGREGWLVLAKDKRIRSRPREREAIVEHGVRAFVLTSGQLTAEHQVERFLDNAAAIDRAGEEPGPFVYAVHAKRLIRVFPPSREAR